MSDATARLESVTNQIHQAAARAGRKPEEIRLIAVSKTHPPERVVELFEAGQMLFGENKVQEAKAKIPAVPERIEWHLIGHLQKNKIRQALPLFSVIHSVDSLELARQIHRIAEEEGRIVRALLEVNVAGESSKFGFAPAALEAGMEELLGLDRIDFEGLMCIPPLVPKADDARPYFAKLRNLRDKLERECRVGLPQLSMGMSADFPVAIEEGATMVRVGTALFGHR